MYHECTEILQKVYVTRVTCIQMLFLMKGVMWSGVSWPSGLAYRTQVLVLATECGFESQP